MSAECRTYQSTSYEIKKEIVEKLDKGTPIHKLTKEYNICASTIYNIIKDKDKIKKLDKSQLPKKRIYSKWKELDEKLLKLYQQMKELKNEVNWSQFEAEGLKLMDKFGGPSSHKKKLKYLYNFRRNKIEASNVKLIRKFVHQLEEEHIEKDDIYIMFEIQITMKILLQKMQKNQNETDNITKFKNDRLALILCTNVTANHKLSPLIIYEYENQAIKSKLKNKKKVIFKLKNNKSEDQQIFTNWYDDYIMSVRKHQQKTNKVFLLIKKKKKSILPARTNQSNDFEILPYLQGPKFEKATHKINTYITYRLKKLNCTFYDMKMCRQAIFKIWQKSSPELIRNLCENILKSDSCTKENIPEDASTKSLDIEYKATKKDYDPDNPTGLRKCKKLSVKRYPNKVGSKDLNEEETKALALTLCEKNQSCKTTKGYEPKLRPNSSLDLIKKRQAKSHRRIVKETSIDEALKNLALYFSEGN